jgi:hypothetical protein
VLASPLLALAPAFAAPHTWSVNVGGSGDFVDLQQAVDQAQPGDTILLWGPANGRRLLRRVTIQKGLTIVGLAPEPVHLYELIVRDVPAGQSVTVVNVSVGAYTIFPWQDDVGPRHEAALVVDCDGPVVFSGCYLRGAFGGLPWNPEVGGPGVRAVRSDVVLLDCAVGGGRGGDCGESITGQVNAQHALVLEDARALVSGSILRGGDAPLTSLGSTREVGGRGGDGVRANGQSHVWLLDSTALGGAGEEVYNFPPGGLGAGGNGGNGVRIGAAARGYARATTIQGGLGGWEPSTPGHDGRDVVGDLHEVPGATLGLEVPTWTRDIDAVDARLEGDPGADAVLLVGDALVFRGAGAAGVLVADGATSIPLGPLPPTGEATAAIPLPALAPGAAQLLVVQSAFVGTSGLALGEPRALLVLDASWLPDEQRLYVDAAAPTGGDGLSWTGALQSLHQALEAAPGIGPGLTDIWIREGVYRPAPPGPHVLEPFYVKSRTRVYGGFAGTEIRLSEREPELHPTILSGDLLGDDDAGDASRADNSRLVLAIGPWDPRESARLDGLVIRSGFGGPLLGGTTFPLDATGVELQGSVDVVGCTFADNRRGTTLLAGEGSDLRVVGCRFLGNQGQSFSGSYGSGICNPGWLGNDGRALFANCEFSGNATARGGAICTSVATRIVNCTFYGNSAVGEGGAVYQDWGCPELVVENSLFWGNTAPVDPDISLRPTAAVPRVDFSLFAGGATSSWGVGNVEGPARLLDPEGPDGVLGTLDDDLTPRTSSPAVDAGNNAFLPADELDVDADGVLLEPLPIDVAGRPRRVDDPNVVDTGAGTAPIVDMGSRERP